MDNENRQIQTATGTELAVTAGAAMAKAEIESAYIMALKKPRSWADVRAKILEACKRPVFAEKAEYKKPIGGGKTLNGPSVRFAETAVQAAGNIRTVATVIYEDENVIKVSVRVTDLENNISYSKEITLQKTVERKKVKEGQQVFGTRLNSYGDTVYIVEATEDELAVKQAAQESKIVRNCGLKLIPGDIIEEAMQVAKETRAKGVDPKAESNKIVDAFNGLGIKPSEIEKYLGKPIAQLVVADIDDLRGIYTAIKEGEAKWSDYLEDAEVTGGAKSFDEKLREAKANVKKPEKPAETITDATVTDPRATMLEEIEALKAKAGLRPDFAEKTIKTLLGETSEKPTAEILAELPESRLNDVIKGLQGIVDAKAKR